MARKKTAKKATPTRPLPNKRRACELEVGDCGLNNGRLFIVVRRHVEPSAAGEIEVLYRDGTSETLAWNASTNPGVLYLGKGEIEMTINPPYGSHIDRPRTMPVDACGVLDGRRFIVVSQMTDDEIYDQTVVLFDGDETETVLSAKDSNAPVEFLGTGRRRQIAVFPDPYDDDDGK